MQVFFKIDIIDIFNLNTLSQEIVKTFDQQISLIVNKFHGRRSKDIIGKWLSNFPEEDMISALDILQRLRYVSEDELFQAADDIVDHVDSEVPIGNIIYFYPIAKYGKSATLMSYYFQKSSPFKKLERKGRALFVQNEYQVREMTFNKNSVLVFFDDFFGSGRSFEKYYKAISAISKPEFKMVERVYAAALYYMPQAEVTIKTAVSGIKLLGEPHPQIFGSDPLMFSSHSQRKNYRQLAYHYSAIKRLFVEPRTKHQHFLGFEESEALITFPYVPPNNTLPIIWSGRSNWYPLFPRMEENIFNQLKAYKEQLMVAATKLDLGLPEHFAGFHGVNKVRFITFGLLRMLKQQIVVPQIAALMGVGIKEIEAFIGLAEKMGFVNKNHALTEQGLSALEEILNLIKLYKKDVPDHHSPVTIKQVPYVPLRISGK